jgi:hypothetical protein
MSKDKTSSVKLNRKDIAKYTHKDREVKKMTDHEFYDYAMFLVRQQDVHIAEGVRNGVENVRNVRKIKSISAAKNVINIVFIVLLGLTIATLIIVAIVYYFVFYIGQGDQVKGTINMKIFLKLCWIFIFFALFYFLVSRMTSTMKKIISLL